jgi:sporulation protein YlmC with PRC-barrel domain
MKCEAAGKKEFGTPVDNFLFGETTCCPERKRTMSLKSLLAATALATLVTSPGLAQVAPDMGERKPLDQKEGVQTERPAPLNTTDAQSPTNSRAGGALAGNQVMVEDLGEMNVNLTDKEDFGKVAGTVLNLQTGQVEKLLISTGGFLGAIGDTIYEVPWNKVAEVNKSGKEIRINATQAEVQPQSEDRAQQDN